MRFSGMPEYTLGDTVSGLKALAENFPAAPIIVWLNAYFGAIAMDGKRFMVGGEAGVFAHGSATVFSTCSEPAEQKNG